MVDVKDIMRRTAGDRMTEGQKDLAHVLTTVIKKDMNNKNPSLKKIGEITDVLQRAHQDFQAEWERRKQ